MPEERNILNFLTLNNSTLLAHSVKNGLIQLFKSKYGKKCKLFFTNLPYCVYENKSLQAFLFFYFADSALKSQCQSCVSETAEGSLFLLH